jgi:hypothetical protein
VKQRVQQIHGLFVWYAVYWAKLPLSSLEGGKAVVGDVRCATSRMIRALKAADTLKKRIEDRRLPPNGLADLLKAVYSLVPWARSLQGQGVDKDTYDAFMRLLYAAMYVSSPQGRQSGLMDLKYEQHKALLDKGFANTTRFKTQDKYTYQPVTYLERDHEGAAGGASAAPAPAGKSWPTAAQPGPLGRNYSCLAEDCSSCAWAPTSVTCWTPRGCNTLPRTWFSPRPARFPHGSYSFLRVSRLPTTERSLTGKLSPACGPFLGPTLQVQPMATSARLPPVVVARPVK